METKSEILKQAATTLRTQQSEIKELREKIACEQAAEKILQKLLENETISPDEILTKLSELRAKSLDDLVIMEKAAELYQGGFFSGFGKLSDQTDGTGLDPLTSFLTEGD
jgi:glucose-6-phosphate-specific signal transduction histidine kinase